MDPYPEQAGVDSFRWTGADLLVFSAGFALTILFVPVGALFLIRFFRPDTQPADLSGMELILLQGLLDLVLVGFILLLVKVVHGRSFLETIHWHRTRAFPARFLIVSGIALALAVVVLSSFLPIVETPIERLISSTRSIMIFAIFGIGVAPLVEEVIFRGFLFKVFSDLTSARAAVPLTTLLFAGMHVLQLWGNWGAMLLIFGVGYFLGLVRERSGSVISSWIVHAAYNSMIFGLTAIGMLLGLEGQP